MTSDGVRVRINYSTQEIELEGAEASVNKYLERFAPTLDEFKGAGPPKRTPNSGPKIPMELRKDMENETPIAFGEYLHKFPRDTTDVDKVLIAASYVQRHESEDDSFNTRSVNSALKDQGIKVTNASECVRRNLQTRRIFALGKGTYRVSQDGNGYLAELSNRGPE